MLVRVFTLQFNSLLGGFDDAPMREFIKDKEVLSINEHFFVKNEMPYLVLVMTYLPTRAETLDARSQTGDGKNESWRELVKTEDVPLFNALRDWRSERCKRDGLPPYIICTNRQLAMIVNTRPESFAKLAQIDGIGKAKVEKYGEEILAVLLPQPQEPEHSHQSNEERA
jgi:ATP-dependent DNA helicase RecQ